MMVTIWVHNKMLDAFVNILKTIEHHDEVSVTFYTHPMGKEYIQMAIGYTEYVNLRDKITS